MTSLDNQAPLIDRGPETPAAVTDDAFLGDRLYILQPSSGYRAGIDAVLLAASMTNGPAEPTILDCGSGVGTVGLCVAVRCPDARVTLVEREPVLIDLARRNIDRNGLQARVSVVPGDVTSPAQKPEAPRLPAESFDHVLANPPYHDDSGGTPARDPLKRASHAMPAPDLDSWVRFAARMNRPGGRVSLIHKADALPALLVALQDRYGAIAVTPIHPYADKPAGRVLVSGIKASRAPVELRPPVVLHELGGGFTPYVGRILREGAPLTSSRT
ncbi:MAG: methyltransferase [Hyphomicrobium sp.]|nr:methyltransferase [Hyphomicrobium sp.]